MSVFAHVGGLPFEELTAATAGAGTALLVVRTRVSLWLRRRPRDDR